MDEPKTLTLQVNLNTKLKEEVQRLLDYHHTTWRTVVEGMCWSIVNRPNRIQELILIELQGRTALQNFKVNPLPDNNPLLDPKKPKETTDND